MNERGLPFLAALERAHLRTPSRALAYYLVRLESDA